MENELIISVYAPALTDGDGRGLAAIHALERAFPDVRLAWDIMDDGSVIEVPERDQWVLARTANGRVPLLCNGDESYPVTISGHETSAISAPGGRPLLDLHADLPLDEKVAAAATDILAGIGDGALAYWGVANPSRTAVEVAEQTIHPPNPHHPSKPPPRGLPGIKRSWEIPSPEIPGRLGWLNYWSPAAAAAVGFPDPARDADLLARARRTPGGAWIVQLSETPLDLDIPAHLDALRRAYDRFPAIGGRALKSP